MYNSLSEVYTKYTLHNALVVGKAQQIYISSELKSNSEGPS